MYAYVYVDGKTIAVHRHLMEQQLGRPLETWEQVHHVNEDKADNRLENLRVMEVGDHVRLHNQQKPHFLRYLLTPKQER